MFLVTFIHDNHETIQQMNEEELSKIVPNYAIHQAKQNGSKFDVVIIKNGKSIKCSISYYISQSISH